MSSVRSWRRFQTNWASTASALGEVQAEYAGDSGEIAGHPAAGHIDHFGQQTIFQGVV